MKYAQETIVMSDSNKNVLHSWLPDSEPKAVIVLSHGMVEHAARYEPFAAECCKRGIALYAEDHRGHGKTAELASQDKSGMFGFLAEKKGFERVADDIHEEILLAKKRWPSKKVFLFGHSFGSFVSQCVIEKYGTDLDGCILCGTAGPRPLTIAFAKNLGRDMTMLFGKRHVAKLLDKIVFGSYNKRIKNPATKSDWISRDAKTVAQYRADPFCTFIPTTGFFRDLFEGLSLIHKKSNLKKIPQSLSVLFIEGTADPVGNYAKTVEKLFDIYTRKLKLTDATAIYYGDARHELLNEINGANIVKDVLLWVESRIQ